MSALYAENYKLNSLNSAAAHNFDEIAGLKQQVLQAKLKSIKIDAKQ